MIHLVSYLTIKCNVSCHMAQSHVTIVAQSVHCLPTHMLETVKHLHASRQLDFIKKFCSLYSGERIVKIGCDLSKVPSEVR